MRAVSFHGRSLGAIRTFPLTVWREAGHQLDRVQRRLEPNDWKPMSRVGKGVRELRIRENGQYRVIYLAVFGDVVHVLHVFRKKTQKTRQHDIRVAQKAYKYVMAKSNE